MTGGIGRGSMLVPSVGGTKFIVNQINQINLINFFDETKKRKFSGLVTLVWDFTRNFNYGRLPEFPRI